VDETSAMEVSTSLSRNLKIEYNIKNDVVRIFPEGWMPPFGCYIYNEENINIFGCITNSSCITIKVGSFKNGFYTLVVEDKFERKVCIFQKGK
jgi:hypothetical protein